MTLPILLFVKISSLNITRISGMNLNKPLTTDTELRIASGILELPLIGIYFRNNINSFEILDWLKNNKVGAIVINLDEVGSHGTHWVCAVLIFNDKTIRIYYWDSFGIGPPISVISAFAELETIANIRFGPNFEGIEFYYNNIQTQDIDDGYCGQWCLAFIKEMTANPQSGGQRMKKKKYHDFISSFYHI
jgi:hypothetical protein